MTATSNTALWDKLCRVPPEHLKGFQRAGGFKGTAIKPMWSIHRMTEVFGPIGYKWGVDRPQFEVVPAGDEIMVYCTVAVWHGEEGGQRFFGVGGDKVRAVFSGGPKNDDEAFKKAYTDALTNALKLLGVGADVHMGLWDGNKYVDEKPEPAPEKPAPAKTTTHDKNPIVEEAYKAMDIWLNNIGNTGTVDDLAEFWKENQKTIKALPADWLKELTAKKDEVKTTLLNKVAA